MVSMSLNKTGLGCFRIITILFRYLVKTIGILILLAIAENDPPLCYAK